MQVRRFPPTPSQDRRIAAIVGAVGNTQRVTEHELRREPADSGSETPPSGDEAPRSRARFRPVLFLVLLMVLTVFLTYTFTDLPERFGRQDAPTAQSTGPVDSDGDGLTDEVEQAGWRTQSGEVFVTDATLADTDGDGLTDGDEAGDLATIEPAESASGAPAEAPGSEEDPVASPTGDPTTPNEATYVGYSDPLVSDTDEDELNDAEEADLSLSPLNADTDEDGLSDAQEVNVVGTAADVADTDGDGFDDGYEVDNREENGLDPLWVDVKVSKMSYATDFAIGSVMGDAWRKDSMAWLAGNLASSGSSSVPVIGWFVGPLVDARDAIASAIRGDWVSSGFSAVGAIPYAGDAIEVPAKALKFVERNPESAALVVATIAATSKVPEKVKIEAARGIWKGWDDLRDAGASEKALLQLSKGRTNLDDLADSLQRSTHVGGAPAKFFDDGPAGERFLEDLYGVNVSGANKQVSAATTGCADVCNPIRRRFDVLADGVAHESKVGYVRLTSSIEKQIRSDAWLTSMGEIEGAHWHFFASAGSNSVGADKKVLDLLDELGIPYTVHLPA